MFAFSLACIVVFLYDIYIRAKGETRRRMLLMLNQKYKLLIDALAYHGNKGELFFSLDLEPVKALLSAAEQKISTGKAG